MKPRDLVLAAANFQSPSRIPVTPYDGNFCARLTGTPIDRYCSDARILADVQIEAQSLTHQDMLVAQSDGYYMAEGFGLRTRSRTNDTPVPTAPVLNTIADAEDLTVPDPRQDGRMPVYLKAIRLLRDKVGDELAVRATGTGPLSLAGHLLGTERFVMELAILEVEPDEKKEAFVRQLMTVCMETTVRFALAALDAGADVVQIGDSLASLDMISPTIYHKWAHPFECMFFERIRPAAEAKGARGLLHICGDTTIILDDMANTGAHILEVDWKVNLANARNIVGERVSLMGNLDPSAVLLGGSPDNVSHAAKGAISAASTGKGGFLLGSGCEVAPDTPLANMIAMAESVHTGSVE